MIFINIFEVQDMIYKILSNLDGLSLLMIGSLNKTLHTEMHNRINNICKNTPQYLSERIKTLVKENYNWRALVIGAHIGYPKKCDCLNALLGIESNWKNIPVTKVSCLNTDKKTRSIILPYGEAQLVYNKDGINSVFIVGITFNVIL